MTNNHDPKTELPAGWIWTIIGEISDQVNPGFASGKHNSNELGIPHLRPMNISPEGNIDLTEVKYVQKSEYDALKKGDVLFNNTNSPVWVGKTTYIKNDTEWAYSNHMTRIRFYPEVANSAWIAYHLHYLSITGFFQLHCKHHVNQASINTTFLSKNVPIPLPPLPEQHRIVDKIEELFSDLDHSVAALETARQQLDIYRQAVLKHAFEGKLTEQWRKDHPDLTGFQNLSGLIRAERKARRQQELADWQAEVEAWEAQGKPGRKPRKPRKPKDLPPLTEAELDELPSLPEGWVWVQAEALSEFITKGTTPKKHNLYSNNGEIPFIKVYNLTHTGELDFGVNPTFTNSTTHNGFLARSIVFPGDVLMNIVGPPLGKVSLVPDTYPEWNINQAIVRYRPYDTILSRKYLKHFLLSETTIRGMMRKSKATAGQFNLTLEICRDLLIPLCSLPEQRAIVEEIEARLSVVDKLAETIDAALQQAAALRQSILKQAFAGKLVPQNPNDEPAEKLLERIEKARLRP